MSFLEYCLLLELILELNFLLFYLLLKLISLILGLIQFFLQKCNIFRFLLNFLFRSDLFSLQRTQFSRSLILNSLLFLKLLRQIFKGALLLVDHLVLALKSSILILKLFLKQFNLSLRSKDLALDILLPLLLLDQLLCKFIHLGLVVVELDHQAYLLLLQFNHVLLNLLVFNKG